MSIGALPDPLEEGVWQVLFVTVNNLSVESSTELLLETILCSAPAPTASCLSFRQAEHAQPAGGLDYFTLRASASASQPRRNNSGAIEDK